MITRSEYLENSKELHEEYYGQFVTDGIINIVIRRFGIEELKLVYGADKNFNQIPLGQWDSLTNCLPSYVNAGLKNVGDYKSLAVYVCILKAAARQAVLKAEILEEVR